MNARLDPSAAPAPAAPAPSAPAPSAPPASAPAATVPLYEAHRKVYAREVQGVFSRLRALAVWGLLGLFYALPWVRFNHRQAVLFDLPARKFYLFGLTLFPQDFYLLTWLLTMAALSLFFFTAIAGRLWCGYACPQTVWTEIFVWMERLTEGDRHRQMKLDRAPWSLHKLGRKASKQFLWLTFAAFTGVSFVGYFSDIELLIGRIAALQLSFWEAFWILFYGFATYGNAGFLREQVCKYMCPYARFQSAMFDKQTLIISYDETRGEPRGARRSGAPKPAGQGDCIDCTLCVQVCPTGIDIRHGLQYECIACAACIDACDSVMQRIGSPPKLIRYSTEAAEEGKGSRLVRPRILIYACILSSLMASFAYAVTHRLPFALDVIRDRNALYRELDDGRIENVYSVRVINKDQHPHTFRLRALDLPGAVIDSDAPERLVPAEDVSTFVIRVRVAPDEHGGGRTFRLALEALDRPDLTVTSTARFLEPRS
jgi:cytochrome c oxidase accessory protein FixG